MSETKDPKAWLIGLTLGGVSSGMVPRGFYEGKSGLFEIFGMKSADDPSVLPLVETKTYRLYVTKLPTGQLGLMKISLTEEFNYILKKEINILESMQVMADDYDQSMIKSNNAPPYYGATFPKVIEKMDADGRVAVFLGYNECIESYKQLMPLSIITEKERTDLKTAHWILGKLLKILVFFHNWGMNYAITAVNTSNVLIETDLHGVFVLDFSEAIKKPGEEERINDIRLAAKLAWEIAGGTEESEPPHDLSIMSKENYVKYVSFIRRLMNGETKGAYEEQMAIYELSDEIWPKIPKPSGAPGLKRQFHKFCTYPK